MSYPVLTATSDKRVSWVRRGGVVLGMVERRRGGGGGGVLERRGKDIPDQPMKDEEGRESRKIEGGEVSVHILTLMNFYHSSSNVRPWQRERCWGEIGLLTVTS